MTKHLANVVLIAALFLPFLAVVWLARQNLPPSASLLEMGFAWQAAILLTASFPVLVLRRLGLLQPRRGEEEPRD